MPDIEELIVRSLQGKTSPAEEERLRRWCASDPENERKYREAERLWASTGLAAMIAEDRPAAEELIARAERMDRTSSAPPGDRGERSPDGTWTDPPSSGGARSGTAPAAGTGDPASSGWIRTLRNGALAAGLLAIGFGLANFVERPEAAPDLEPLTTEIETGPGEMTTVTLSDGSSVRLGPHSRLRAVEGLDERRVRLDGRAFFGVEEDPSRSFVVETEYGEAVALGTRFEVRAEEDFRVLVVDGTVSVSVAEADLEVSGGEMTRSSRDEPPAKSTVRDIYGELAWMGNHLAFRATPLSDALLEIERRYEVEIDLRAPALQDVPVTATFTGQPVEEVVSVLCEIVSARCTLGADGRIHVNTPR